MMLNIKICAHYDANIFNDVKYFNYDKTSQETFHGKKNNMI